MNDPNSAPVTIQLVDNNNHVVQSVAGATGSYSFTKVPVGNYTVKLVAPNIQIPPVPVIVWSSVNVE